MDWNDTIVIVCDVLSTVCLGILSVGTIANTVVFLEPWQAITLFSIGKATSTVLQHMSPVGSKRA